jgi:hypothetical protein
MKNKITYSILFLAVGGFALFGISFFLKEAENAYQPKKEDASEGVLSAIHGANEYFNFLKRNVKTGRIEMEDVLAAQKEVADFDKIRPKSGNNSGLNLQWEEMGPDNVGGRTRAFLIDPTNPKKMWAGAVAGGIYYSENGGGSWKKVNDLQECLTVSCITRAADGTIYYGTGEGFGGPSFNPAAYVGCGIFKSTDNKGTSFVRLESTKPANNVPALSGDFAVVNKIAAHPTNKDIIYAVTNRGFRVTTDGGQTWEKDWITGSGATSGGQDVDVHPDGTTVVCINNRVWVSPNGSKGSFVEKSNSNQPFVLPSPSSLSRIEFAIAPSNSNVIYASAANSGGHPQRPYGLAGIYVSRDKGDNWHLITGGGSSFFEPFGRQGEYDNALTVSSDKDNEIVLGGLQVWRWKGSSSVPPAGQWELASVYFGSEGDPKYVHPDIHDFIWHPTNPNTYYVATDGGMYITTDRGLSFKSMNRDYITYQCYSVGYSGRGDVLSGSQDNGTIMILSNSPINGERYGIAVGGGDGGYCDISQLNPNTYFYTSQNGNLNRSKSFMGGGSQFSPVNCEGGPFVTPIKLWESFNDENSIDTVVFRANRIEAGIGVGNGIARSLTATLSAGQASAIIVPGTIEIKAGLSGTFTDDGAGALIGPGTGTVNYQTGDVVVNFATAPLTGTSIKAYFGTRYNRGSTIMVTSGTAEYKFPYTLPVALNFGDSILIKDKIQSKLVLATGGGLWLSRRGHEFGADSSWIKIANFTAQNFEFTTDGNILYAGTSSGQFVRISGLSQLKEFHKARRCNDPVSSMVTITQLGSFGGRAITGISVNPNNPDHVLVSLGNYGETDYVYEIKNATTAPQSSGSANFTNKTGNLPRIPVYSALIDQGVADGSRLLIGTEYGVYSSSNGGQTWIHENLGMPNVPVHMLRQQYLENDWDSGILNRGIIYAGTNGRGVWRTSTLKDITTGIKQPEESFTPVKGSGHVNVYPNPAKNQTSVAFNLNKNVDSGIITLHDMSGRQIKTINLDKLTAGNQVHTIDVSDLNIGTYFVRVSAGEISKTTKIVILK